MDLAAELTGLSADGSATATTTKLSLTFDQDITGLAASDLTLEAGSTGAAAGTLTRTGTGTYELALSGITDSGTVTLSVYKKGYIMAGSQKQVTVYYSSGQALTQAAFTTLSADGSEAATTIKLSLTFNADITGLAAGNISLGGNTGAAAGTLTRTGTGVYELTVTGITQGGTVTVMVAKSGYDISGSPKTVTVYYYSSGEPPIQAAFTGLSADGSATATTGKLSLAFDKDITGIVAADLTLHAGSTGAVKGALSRTGTGTYELALSRINQSGEITLAVRKAGYAISGSPKTARVFYYYNPGEATFTITFAQIADSAPSITGPTLYRISNSGPTTATLSVENPEQYTSISWQVQNTTVTGTGASFTLSVADPAYNQIASHFVTVTVMKGTVPYNKTVSFQVEL